MISTICSMAISLTILSWVTCRESVKHILRNYEPSHKNNLIGKKIKAQVILCSY